jgi:nitroreductase
MCMLRTMGDDADVLERILTDRFSSRAFSAEPLPRTVIERMFCIAQRTASWCNTQPWGVFVTSGVGTERFRTALSDAALTRDVKSDIPFPPEYRGVYQERRRESGYALYNALGIDRSDSAGRQKQVMENFRFFGAPHAAIVTADATLGTYGILDVGGYIATITIAAQALGIGLVPQAAVATYSRAIREFFEIPDDRIVVAGFSFGYTDHDHPVNSYRTTRAELADAVQWVDE